MGGQNRSRKTERKHEQGNSSLVLIGMSLYPVILTVAAYFFRKKVCVELDPKTLAVVVIANNCDDATAAEARGAGAEVLERADPVYHGKEQAPDWFLKEHAEMGLSRTRRIIGEHHGSMTIDSMPGLGIKVGIRIPRLAAFPAINKGMSSMEISEERIGKVTVLKLTGRLDSVSAPGLKDRVKACARDGQLHLVIDMAGIDFVDSSGLGSLVASLRSLNKGAGDMRLAALQDRVRAVFELIRLHQIFEIFDSADTAVDSFRNA